MKTTDKGDILLPTRDGYVLCPQCLARGQVKKIYHLRPDTVGRNMPIFCRACKTEYIVDIVRGLCRSCPSP